MADDSMQPQMPTPDTALGRLDRFVGTWSMEGHLVGSNEDNIKGKARRLQRRRPELRWWLASEPRCGRDRERALRHQRAPREVTQRGRA